MPSPQEVEQIVDASAGVRALGGDLQTFLQVQLARALGAGGGGMLSAPSELALGLTASKMIGNPATLPTAMPSPQALPSWGNQLALESTKENYSLPEASYAFGVSIEALENAIQQGVLPSYELLGEKVLKANDIKMLMHPKNPKTSIPRKR